MFKKYYNYNPDCIRGYDSNKPYQKIKNLIKKHKNSDDKLAHAKKSAYQCFLSCINDRKTTEKEAIKTACGQMTIDADKYSNGSFLDGGGGLFLSMIGQSQNTIDDMIHYIEGFN